MVAGLDFPWSMENAGEKALSLSSLSLHIVTKVTHILFQALNISQNEAGKRVGVEGSCRGRPESWHYHGVLALHGVLLNLAEGQWTAGVIYTVMDCSWYRLPCSIIYCLQFQELHSSGKCKMSKVSKFYFLPFLLVVLCFWIQDLKKKSIMFMTGEEGWTWGICSIKNLPLSGTFFWFLLKYFLKFFMQLCPHIFQGKASFRWSRNVCKSTKMCILSIFPHRACDMHTRTSLSRFAKHLIYVVFSNTY